MSKRILTIYKSVVINKILITCVIRRIYINNINLACMGISQCCKRLKVIALDEDMIRSFRILADDSSFFDFCQNGEFFSESLFNILRLILPNKSIFFMSFQ